MTLTRIRGLMLLIKPLLKHLQLPRNPSITAGNLIEDANLRIVAEIAHRPLVENILKGLGGEK